MSRSWLTFAQRLRLYRNLSKPDQTWTEFFWLLTGFVL